MKLFSICRTSRDWKDFSRPEDSRNSVV